MKALPAQQILSLMLGACGLVGGAHAQQVPTPGEVQEQLRSAPTLPRTLSEPLIPAPTPAGAGIPAGGKTVHVTGFDIAGSQAIPTDELQAAVASYLGRPLTLLEIYDAADQITRYYRTHGYTLASAYVPEQKIGDGVVRIEVLEGTLGEVKIEGTSRTKPGFLLWQLDQLKSGAVLRDEPLEHELLLLNDIPGLRAKAVVQPGAIYGTSDLVVAATDKLIDGGIRYNNYGRESIGEERLEGNAALNGLLGYGDRLEFNAVYAEADLLHYGRVGYSLPVSPWGTRASIYYASYDYEVDVKKLGSALSLLDIDGEGDNFGAKLDHPIWRSRDKNLFVGIGYDRTVTDQIESTFGSRTKQHLSLANFSALFSYLASDRSFSTLGGNFSTNFNSADRVVDPVTRLLGVENNAQTAKLQLDLSHYRSLYRQLALFTRFTGVASVDPLVDLERFRIGGPNSVRAYASSELAGDSGYFFSTELQYPIPFVTGMPTSIKAFFDTGTVYRKNHNLMGVEHSESLSGAGVGLQTSAYRTLFFDAAIAQPIGAYDTTDSNRGVRFWVNVSANF